MASTKAISPSHDTGFPECFATHTTSRRHPDAKVGHSAYITAEDVDPLKMRHRMPFRNKRKSINHGVITPEMELDRLVREASEDVNMSKSILGSTDSAIDMYEKEEIRQFGDGAESVGTQDSATGKHSPISPTSTKFESTVHSHTWKRRSFFNKLRGHRQSRSDSS